jgi:hypothetical protein
VLFRDTAVQLAEQLQMVEEMSEHFNPFARAVGAAEINLEELRKSLQPEIDRQVSIWVALARSEMLNTFGEEREVQAAIAQYSAFFRTEIR